jgi:hypothetical protein
MQRGSIKILKHIERGGKVERKINTAGNLGTLGNLMNIDEIGGKRRSN